MRKTYIAFAALLGVSIVWGAAFVLMKDAIVKMPIYDFLSTRFLIAALVMLLVKPSVLKSLTKDIWIKGSLLGLALSTAYVAQTIGLAESTAAISGFLTGLYVVVTPFLTWWWLKIRAEKRVVFGVILALLGLALISINGFSIEPGHLWLVLCAVLFAVHIAGLSVWSPGRSSYALTFVQLIVVGVTNFVPAVADGYTPPEDSSVWFAVLFTAVFSTAFAFLVQTWAQGIMDASRVAIILTSEVIFTAIIAVAVGQEVLQLRTILGGALMLAAMLWVEWPAKQKLSA